MMKKIKKSQLKEVSELFADMFLEYPLYDIIDNGNKPLRKKRIYYFFRFETYESQKYCYISEDGTCAAIVRAPSDKEKSTFGLFANPRFAYKFFSTVGWCGSKIAKEYLKFVDNSANDVLQKGDYYLKNIGVVAKARGRGLLGKMLLELCGNSGIVLETHDPKNVKIYQNLGFILEKTLNFRCSPHFVMRRPPIAV